MTPFALDFDSIFNSNLDKESEKGYDIIRQMASMKDVPLPASATPKIDLKTAAIGSILAGILGNAEGAGGFLQGMIQGNQVKRQQMDQDEARKFQQAKMAQDRELGIMKTEAEIANQKANRLLSRQEQFNRRITDERNRRDKIENDKNNFLERLATAPIKSMAEAEKMFSFAEMRGIMVPPDLKAEVIGRVQKAEQSKALAPRIKELYATVKDQSIEPQTRQWAGAMLINGINTDENLASLLGAHPLEKDRLIGEIQADVKRATIANRTGVWTLNNLIKEGRIKDADFLSKTMKNDILALEKKYADEGFRLENDTKKARLSEIKQSMKIERDKFALDKKVKESELSGGGSGRRALTATAELNAWAKANNDVIDAQGAVAEANEMINYWENIRKKVKSGAISNVDDSDIERSVMFFEAQKRIATQKLTDAQSQVQQSQAKIDSLSVAAPAVPPSGKAAALRKKYGY